MNVPLLLWHANIVLLALLGVLVLLRLPRLFARLSVPSEWLQGHVFAHKALPATRRRADHSIARRPTYSSEKTAYGGSDDSHTIHAHAQYIQRLDKHAAGGPPANCPPHLAACPRFFLASFFSASMSMVPPADGSGTPSTISLRKSSMSVRSMACLLRMKLALSSE